MKYSIQINQVGVVDAGLADKTDIIDWALIDYLAAWQINHSAVILNGHVWLSYGYLIEQMPLLGLRSKSSVSTRFKKIENLGLITVEYDMFGKAYFRLSKLALSVIHFDNRDFNGDQKITKKNNGGVVNDIRPDEHPVRPDEHPVRPDEHPVRPDEHILNNHIYNNQRLNKFTNVNLSATPKKQKTDNKKNNAPLEILVMYGIIGQLAEDFIQHRSENKALITRTAMDGYQREANKAGVSIVDAVTLAIEYGWVGFRADWYFNKQVNKWGIYGQRRGLSREAIDSTDCYE